MSCSKLYATKVNIEDTMTIAVVYFSQKMAIKTTTIIPLPIMFLFLFCFFRKIVKECNIVFNKQGKKNSCPIFN